MLAFANTAAEVLRTSLKAVSKARMADSKDEDNKAAHAVDEFFGLVPAQGTKRSRDEPTAAAAAAWLPSTTIVAAAATAPAQPSAAKKPRVVEPPELPQPRQQCYDISAARNRLRDETKWWSNELSKLLVAPKTWLRKNKKADAVYPPQDQVFEAVLQCPDPTAIRVIIVGLDPYFGAGEACGLCFGVPQNHKLKRLPGSLVHILAEANRQNPCLSDWAKQGVLLLNTVLTVDAGGPSLSHKQAGWQAVTRHLLKTALLAATDKTKLPVCLAWGGDAFDLLTDLKNETGLAFPLLSSTHPSGLSWKNTKARLPPFYKCGHFERTNHILVARGQAPIQWR